jgi:GH24 family phage-related lysozyme (muramidase)
MRTYPDFLPGFLKQAEAVRNRAYQDSANVWTCGVGHTGPDVHPGMLANVALIDKWLAQDIQTAMRKLYGVLDEAAILRLSEHQWAALISFAFNLGVKPSWGLWKLINAGKLDAIPGQIMRFDQARDPATGKLVVLRGLERRRMAEKALWLTEDHVAAQALLQAAPEAALPPSSETRAVDTPPQPSHTSMVKPIIMGAGAAATAAAPVVSTMRDAIAPMADQSEHVRQLLGLLAMIGAGLAILTVAFMTWQSRQAHQ